MTGEAHTVARVRLRAMAYGVRLFRNNSGVATNPNGRPVRFGLGNDSAKLNAVLKSSDLIGLTQSGRFVAIECKRSGWRYRGTDAERAQLAFIDLVLACGGIAGFCTCEGDLDLIIINQAIKNPGYSMSGRGVGEKTNGSTEPHDDARPIPHGPNHKHQQHQKP